MRRAAGLSRARLSSAQPAPSPRWSRLVPPGSTGVSGRLPWAPGGWFSSTKSICLWRGERREVLPGTTGVPGLTGVSGSPKSPSLSRLLAGAGHAGGSLGARFPTPCGSADEEPQ